MRVQLLYFDSCPNVEGTRASLRHALEAAGMPTAFEEIDVEANAPEDLRLWGSPTILVDGKDLFGASVPTGCTCRIYSDGEASSSGVPTGQSIIEALRRRRESRSWIKSVLVIPGAVLPLLPAATCPACIAAYAGVVSALGLGFLVNERVMVPLILFFLGLSVATVGWAWRTHRHIGPFAATLAGAAGVVLGRIALHVPVFVYAGVALLIAGTAWNLWFKRPRPVPLVKLGSTRSRPV